MQQSDTIKGYKIIIKDSVLGINEENEQAGISFIAFTRPIL